MRTLIDRADREIEQCFTARRLFDGVDLMLRTSLPIEECRARLQTNITRSHWWGGLTARDAWRSWRNNGACVGTIDGDSFYLQWHTTAKKRGDSALRAHGTLHPDSSSTVIHLSFTLARGPIVIVALWLGLVGVLGAVVAAVATIRFALFGTTPTFATLVVPVVLQFFGVVVAVTLAGTAQSDSLQLRKFLMTTLEAYDLDVPSYMHPPTHVATHTPEPSPSVYGRTFDAALREYFDDYEREPAQSPYSKRDWSLALIVVVPPVIVIAIVAALGYMSWS